MLSQYDTLAELSEQTAQSPLRRFYEEHMLFSALGDVGGQSVLDLACGTGLYSRKIKARGARQVLGIDMSEGMIGYAKFLETSEPRGVQYRVADASNLGSIDTFDHVFAAYLLHYAPTRDALFSMCSHIARALRPGGRLTTLCVNPAINVADPNYYADYGFLVTGGQSDGELLTLQIVVPGMQTKLFAHRWSRLTYEEALLSAGLVNVRWHQPQCDQEGLTLFGESYWDAYLQCPHALVLSAVVG